MKQTKIQWADDTVNVVMGCDGCELWITFSRITGEIISLVVRYTGLPEERVSLDVKTTADRFKDQLTKDLIANTVKTLAEIYGQALPEATVKEIIRQVRALRKCYAGVQTERFAGTNAGYPRRFEEPTPYPGRMALAVRASDLTGTVRPDKPWLNGFPRSIFVSDMGDALSRSITFEYLRQEIIDIAASPNGCRHRHLWLTKRPNRMARFQRWLSRQGIPWPDNLMGMTSVTSQQTVGRVTQLRQVDCRMRGLSVEPLWTPVKLPLGGIDLVIVGGESGPGAEPFHVEWIPDLQDQCRRAGAAFFVKQLGSRPFMNGRPLELRDGHGSDWSEWPEELRVREMPDCLRSPVFAAAA